MLELQEVEAELVVVRATKDEPAIEAAEAIVEKKRIELERDASKFSIDIKQVSMGLLMAALKDSNVANITMLANDLHSQTGCDLKMAFQLLEQQGLNISSIPGIDNAKILESKFYSGMDSSRKKRAHHKVGATEMPIYCIKEEHIQNAMDRAIMVFSFATYFYPCTIKVAFHILVLNNWIIQSAIDNYMKERPLIMEFMARFSGTIDEADARICLVKYQWDMNEAVMGKLKENKWKLWKSHYQGTAWEQMLPIMEQGGPQLQYSEDGSLYYYDISNKPTLAPQQGPLAIPGVPAAGWGQNMGGGAWGAGAGAGGGGEWGQGTGGAGAGAGGFKRWGGGGWVAQAAPPETEIETG